jgi:HK97 family phage prohead protease
MTSAAFLKRRLVGGEGTNVIDFTARQLEYLARRWRLDPTAIAAASISAPPMTRAPEAVTRSSAPSGEYVFTISTGSTDRMGDQINVNGWQLGNYRRTGSPVLWGHDSSMPPIGRGRVWVEGNALKGAVTFAGTSFAQKIASLVQSGFVNSTSVGFKPISMSASSDPARQYGIDFQAQELLEWSIVSVPCNADCTLTATPMPKSAEARRRRREVEIAKLRCAP